MTDPVALGARYAMLGKVEGAEKLFLAGRHSRGADLAAGGNRLHAL